MSYFPTTESQIQPALPPFRRRAATVSVPSAKQDNFSVVSAVYSISSWAAQIQPGSPAPGPRSPLTPFLGISHSPRSPKTPRSPPSAYSPSVSYTPRRASFSSNFSISISVSGTRHTSSFTAVALAGTTTRLGDTSFLNFVETPTSLSRNGAVTPAFTDVFAPSIKDEGQEIPNTVNPTTVFITLPPRSKDTSKSAGSAERDLGFLKSIPVPPIPISPTNSTKSGHLKKVKSKRSLPKLRLRSFSIRGFKKSNDNLSENQTNPNSPTKSKAMSSHTLTIPLTSRSKPKRKVDPNPRTRYAHITSAAPAGSGAALALSNEVQLSKLLDGGSTERNVQRVMTGAAAKSGRAHGYGPDAHVGVAAPYRGEHGGELWWDEEERWEVEGLIRRPYDKEREKVQEEKRRASMKDRLRRQKDARGDVSLGAPDEWIPFRQPAHHAVSPISPAFAPSSPGSYSSSSDDESYLGGSSFGYAEMDVTKVVQPLEMFDPARVRVRSSKSRSAHHAHQRPTHAAQDLSAAMSAMSMSHNDHLHSHESAERRLNSRQRRRPAGPTIPPIQVTPIDLERQGRRDFLENSFEPVVTAPPARAPAASIPVSRTHTHSRAPTLASAAASSQNLPLTRTSSRTPSLVAKMKVGRGLFSGFSRGGKERA